MATQDDTNSSYNTDMIDFGELKEKLYFKDLFSALLGAKKKSDISASISGSSLPEYLKAIPPDEYLDALWQTKQD